VMQPEEFRLVGKTALVTGAAGLLGEHHCRALARAGAQVVCADVSEAAVTELSGALTQAYGLRCLGVRLDVTDKASVEGVRDQVVDAFGSLDVLVNNAAINDKFESPELAKEQSRFENYPLEMWRRSIDVNVTGVFLCAQVLGQLMADQGSGSIINIASTYGVVAPDQKLYRRPDGTQDFFKSAAYPTTKGAVLAFTRFLAAYWGDRGVRVNALSPGGVFQDQEPHFVANYAAKTPLGRMARPDDYEGAIVFLASDASRYMTGANLVVDGGFTAC
jgi:NAD(P)-dependent dehydrogenase (short-subunit alcohol dehydrogenase family)